MSWRTIWHKLTSQGKSQKNKSPQKNLEERLSGNFDQDKQLFQAIFKNCGDIGFHDFRFGRNNRRGLLIFQQGLVDKKALNQTVLRSLLDLSKRASANPEKLGDETIYSVGQESTAKIPEIIDGIFYGKTALLIDRSRKALLIDTTGGDKRAIEEPKVEVMIRGPRDSFIESLQTNIALVRRRLKDPRLKFLNYPIGRRSKTKVVLAYMDGLTPPQLLREAQNRLERVDMDVILDAAYIEQMIEDKWTSIFPQMQLTERPDEVVTALTEGRVAVFTDNSPGVLMAPATLNTLMHSGDDYYNRWFVGSFIRGFRFFASIFSIVLPGLYVAFTSFHPELLPSQLALSIAASRKGIPFPAFLEAFMLEAFIELIREAGVRLPGNLGQAISIVGGLIIGQAAVSAQLVSPAMLTVVGLTSISNFTIPNFDAAQAIRVIRFLLLLLASFFGLYGVSFGIILIFSHLAMLKSFGYSYLSPWSPLEPQDLKDSLFRLPWPSMHRRPKFLDPKNEIRLDDERNDSLSKSGKEQQQ